MALTFLVSLLGMALLFATLCKYELTAKHTRAQLRALRRLAERRQACPRSAGASRTKRRAEPAGHGDDRKPAQRSTEPVMAAALLAELPALPLHEAGKYVAAAYIVLFAMVLVYVAIMAIRLSHLERDLGELLAREQADAEGEHV